MKKILTVLLFAAGFGLTASAQETATTTAVPAKKACCAADAKTASADKASCTATVAVKPEASAVAPAAQVAMAATVAPAMEAAAPAPGEKKSCSSGKSCCAGDKKAEAKSETKTSL